MRKILILSLLISLVGCGGGGGGAKTVTNPPPPVPPTTTPPVSGNIVINVLAVTGKDADQFYPNDMLVTRIQHLLNIATSAFQDEGIAVEFKLIQIYKTIYPAEYTSQQALEDITLGKHAAVKPVHGIRDSYKADVVIFYRKYANDGLCGYAWQNGNGGSFSEYEQYAYGVVSIDCPDVTTAHEIGHIFGLAHNVESADGPPAYPYGHGYGVDGQFTTIMGVTSDFGYAARIMQYSNPRRLCGGVPCGNAATADSVRALNNSYTAISNYR